MKRIIFTEDEMNLLRSNKYTHRVTPYQLSFTLEFKRFFMEQREIPGMTVRKILRAAGYDDTMFSKSYLDGIRQRILAEARSPEGLKQPKGLTTQEEISGLTKEDQEKSIKKLQERVEHLEKQIAFLNKLNKLYEEVDE